MRISIHIDGEHDDPALIALASVIGGAAVVSRSDAQPRIQTDTGSGSASAADPKPRKPKTTPVATDAAKPSGSETIENEQESESSVSSTSAPSTVVDAGTGKPVASGEAVTREAAKATAAKLTQIPGGNDTLKELFAKYGAQKFSGIGDDSLTPFAADVEAALAAAATE